MWLCPWIDGSWYMSFTPNQICCQYSCSGNTTKHGVYCTDLQSSEKDCEQRCLLCPLYDKEKSSTKLLRLPFPIKPWSPVRRHRRINQLTWSRKKRAVVPAISVWGHFKAAFEMTQGFMNDIRYQILRLRRLKSRELALSQLFRFGPPPKAFVARSATHPLYGYTHNLRQCWITTISWMS